MWKALVVFIIIFLILLAYPAILFYLGAKMYAAHWHIVDSLGIKSHAVGSAQSTSTTYPDLSGYNLVKKSSPGYDMGELVYGWRHTGGTKNLRLDKLVNYSGKLGLGGIPDTNINECKKYCDDEPLCKAIGYSPKGDCYPKFGVEYGPTTNVGEVTYLKK